MAYPPFPQTKTSFTAFQQAQGDNSFPGPQLDTDLGVLVDAIDTLNSFVRGITRSDGEVGNQTIGRDQLKSELVVGIPQPGVWAASTAYAEGDTVFEALGFYRATQAHTSSVSFDADEATGYWEKLLDFEASFAEELANAVPPLVQAEVPGITEDVLAQVPGVVDDLIPAILAAQVPPIIASEIPALLAAQVPAIVASEVPGIVNPLIAAAVASPFELEATLAELRLHETDAEGTGAGRFRLAATEGGAYMQGTTDEAWTAPFDIWRYTAETFEVVAASKFSAPVSFVGSVSAEFEGTTPQLRFHETDAVGDGAGRFRLAALGTGGVYLQGTTAEDWSSPFNIWRYQNSKFTVYTPLQLSGLPTSASGLATGDVWNDSGTLKIV